MLAEAVECGAAHAHEAIQLVRLVDAVRPLIGFRVRIGVLIGQVAQVGGPGVVEDLGQGGRVLAGRELAIAVVDGDLVPIADAGLIGVGEVDRAVLGELLERVRIVHDGDPSLGAVVVVVAEPERVSDLVRGELTDALESGLVKDVGLLRAGGVRREQSFEDEVILAVAQGAEE